MQRAEAEEEEPRTVGHFVGYMWSITLWAERKWGSGRWIELLIMRNAYAIICIQMKQAASCRKGRPRNSIEKLSREEEKGERNLELDRCRIR